MNKRISIALDKRISIALESGLFVLNARIKKGRPVATLFVTDYIDTKRVLFDIENKRVLNNGIAVTAKDIENLTKLFVKEAEKSVETEILKKKEDDLPF